MGTDKSCGPPSFSGRFEVWSLLVALGASWGGGRALGPRPWLGGALAAAGSLASGPLAWAVLGPEGRGCGALGGPLARQPLAGGGLVWGPSEGSWSGRSLAETRPCWAGGGELGWRGSSGEPLAGGALGPGALGPGGPWPGGALGPGEGGPENPVKAPQNQEIEQPACLDPSPASWSRNPATRDQGAPGGVGPTNPEPKTLNRPPEAKGYDLGLYFSYAKGGLGAGQPSTDVVVKKADVRWPVQDRRWGLTLTFPFLFSLGALGL